MKVVIKNLAKLNEIQKEKIKRSCIMGQSVLNWVEWENKIKASSFKENKGYTGESFLVLLKSRDVVIDLAGFYEKSSTVGWTTLNGEKTHINTYFLNTFEEHEVFSHITHEWCHILGFAHRALLWSSKYRSIPYSVGYMTRDKFVEYYSKPREESFVNNYGFSFKD